MAETAASKADAAIILDNTETFIMFGKKFILGFAVLAAIAAGTGFTETAAAKAKRSATFKVRIENIAAAELDTDGGAKYPFALSPGLFIVNHKKQYFFNEGKRADAALESQAEDGNPEILAKKLLTKVGSIFMRVFNTPNGGDKPGPLLPGNFYEFEFKGSEGMKINLIAMYGQSNDLFYAPRTALDLFDKNGDPLDGDITDSLLLWDAGTELNEAPGIGPNQAPRQAMANTGKAENGVVRLVNDNFMYPNAKNVLRVSITTR